MYTRVACSTVHASNNPKNMYLDRAARVPLPQIFEALLEVQFAERSDHLLGGG